MVGQEGEPEKIPTSILTLEQEALLNLYVKNLDKVFANMKESEKNQVEIETLHLKRLLTS